MAFLATIEQCAWQKDKSARVGIEYDGSITTGRCISTRAGFNGNPDAKLNSPRAIIDGVRGTDQHIEEVKRDDVKPTRVSDRFF
jgi:hypothetical protein